MHGGGIGLIDDGGSRPEVHYEDAGYHSMPVDERGRQTIPSGLIDDGSHNPSLFSNEDQGGDPYHAAQTLWCCWHAVTYILE